MSSHWRSLLFVPANDEARLAKAHLRGADGLILDLEDGVAQAAKAQARETLPAAIAGLRGRDVAVLVRVNAEAAELAADLAAAVRAGVTALMIPKVEHEDTLAEISRSVTAIERERGLPEDGVGLVPLIESPAALERHSGIAGAGRVTALALGVEDFAMALGVEPGPECLDLPCRMIALSAAAHGVQGLGAPITITAFDPPEAFAAATRRAAAMGLTGALCIHPAQVACANLAFSPSPALLAEAREVVDAWERGRGEELGVVSHAGRMIDRPVVERARRLLSRRR